MLTTQQQQIANACVTVVRPDGARGRGVLVPGDLVLTAAHCVTYTTDGAMAVGHYFIDELETTRGMVKVQPLVVEPVVDIAAYGALDGQEFFDECRAFEAWCEQTTPVPLCGSDVPLDKPFPIYIYTHRETWIQASATLPSADAEAVWVEVPEQIEGGTSGSPVITGDGALVGLFSWSSVKAHHTDCHGMAPRPSLALPVWVMRRIQTWQDLDESEEG